MLANLSGKTALVAGGGQGVGRGIVLAMAEQRADVAIADINDDGAAAVVEEVKALGRESFAVHMDMTDKATWTGAWRTSSPGSGTWKSS